MRITRSPKSRAYYNEYDPKAAAWLRELIKHGLIALGDVDERSIVDVQPQDLASYTQVHLFAGIGGWSYALRLAGVPDDFPVWTGSCPCPPFSVAGKRKVCPVCEEIRGVPSDEVTCHPFKTGYFVCCWCGHEWYADERHLWPEFRRLIAERKPTVVFGEQVASKDGRAWLAGVRSTLEALGYGVGGADLCAAGVGAPHIRQRLFWLADASDGRGSRDGGTRRLIRGSDSSGMGYADNDREGAVGEVPEGAGVERARGAGFWDTYDLVYCRDGKARRVEPGTFPLAHGVPGRVGLLRGYGNAICPQVAAEFIGAWLDTVGGSL